MSKRRSHNINNPGEESSGLEEVQVDIKDRGNGTKKSKPHNPATDWTYTFDDKINALSAHTLEDNLTEQIIRCMGWGKNRAKNLIIRNIIKFISPRYNANKYHNFIHASHVTMNCACLLQHLTCELSPIEKLSLLFSAIIHDVDHFGVPNTTLVKKSHDLAILYHDQSVAENHSLAIGLEMLKLPKYELLDGFSEEEKVLFRNNVIELVLCTDIADPMKKKMTCVKLDMQSKGENGALGRLDVSTASGRASLLCLVLRVCDIGACAQSSHTQAIWTHRLFLEQKEAALADGLAPPTEEYFNVDQVAFMAGHVLPQLHRLQATGHVEPDFMEQACSNVTANIDTWKAKGEELLKEWNDATKVQKLT